MRTINSPSRDTVGPMSFKKPFRAVPITLGEHYQAKRTRRERLGVVKLLGGAVGLGLIAALALHAWDRTSVMPSTPAATRNDDPQPIVGPVPKQTLAYDRGTSAADLDAQQPAGGSRSLPASRPVTAAGSSWSYRNCRAARAAGAAPLYIGQPGYGPHMDGDGDGIACEPYHGR